MNSDNKSRLITAIKILSGEKEEDQDIFLKCGEEDMFEILSKIEAEKKEEEEMKLTLKTTKKELKLKVNPEEVINCRQLKGNLNALYYEIDEAENVPLPVEEVTEETSIKSQGKLYQLTGLSLIHI
eukprot:TRINITY_DN7356_c0_g1_i1.p1 TRINITY_DN7356_c0_g1~~TRINITY_DN7356_c0_g1_i1.p1  ORF type:complete len:126 (+),score=43.42 TRINITY_DN7356_c0_g1_i1:176-553(+)